jgi:hypothetical protein
MCLREVPYPEGNVHSVRLICRSGERSGVPRTCLPRLTGRGFGQPISDFLSFSGSSTTTASPTSEVRDAGIESRRRDPVLEHRPVKESGASRDPAAWVLQPVFRLSAPTRPCDLECRRQNDSVRGW